MLNSVNLERLQTFVVAARSSTFAEAAKLRGVSVSAVSQQVRALEGEVGLALFERIGRRVRLTDEGRSLLDTAAVHLSAIFDAIGEVGARRSSLRGLVTLGTPRTFGHEWLEPRLPKLLARAPQLRLSLRFEVPSLLERALLDGALDLAIFARPPELPGIEGRLLTRETLVAVAPPKLPCRDLDEAAARALPWVTFASDRPMHDTWWRATFGRNSKPATEAVVQVPSLEFQLALVKRGVGVAVLPDYLVRTSLQRNEVKELPLQPGKPARNAIFLAWRRGTVTSARFEAVRDALLK
ncbi:MAG: LysR family transcriptional regulator [Archangium gephyra]|uniref:LysR family transcriptional regulator n=1 Tax=Archangium gephyra TaxID=48 RepID=A0A2W5U4P8_9BACT|nr:MAG: LysR family transcriptional regulator [Archangium gephyra]